MWRGGWDLLASWPGQLTSTCAGARSTCPHALPLCTVVVPAPHMRAWLQIRQGRDAAAAEVDRLKQELQRVQTGQEEEAAAAQAALRERVAGLERELFTLKDRYSRQFIDYKQRLDESEGRVRRLRRALTDRDSGDGESDAPAASAEAAPAAAPHGASSVEDVSTWASQLVTKLSEEADTGAAMHCGGPVVESDRSLAADCPV